MTEPTPAATPLDPRTFRDVAALCANAVVVISTLVQSTAGLSAVDHAMTANSFTTVSLDPLLALVCVERTSRFHDAITESGVWGVSVLPDSGAPAANWFATNGRPILGEFDRFPHHRGSLGVILLDEATATMELRTSAVYPGGDHDIFVGAITSLGYGTGSGSLTYLARRYHGITL